MVTMKIETPQTNFCIISKLQGKRITIKFDGDNYNGVEYSWISTDDTAAQELYFFLLRKLVVLFNEKMSEADVLSHIESLKTSTLHNWTES